MKKTVEIIAPTERAAKLMRAIFPDANIVAPSAGVEKVPPPITASARWSFGKGFWVGWTANALLWALLSVFFGAGA